jgi:hypothetical protein
MSGKIFGSEPPAGQMEDVVVFSVSAPMGFAVGT